MEAEVATIRKVLVGLLLVFFLILPMQLQVVKLGIIFLLIAIALKYHRFKISRECIIWNVVLVLYNTGYLVYGCTKGNPGVLYFIATYVLWPILFTFLSGIIPLKDCRFILKVIYWSILCIIVLGVIAFLKFNIFFEMEGEFLGFKASVRPGYPLIAIASPAITPFIFWFFFFFTLKFIQQTDFRFSDLIFLGLGIVFILATSRRVLFLSFLVCVFIIMGLIKVLPLQIRLIAKIRLRKILIITIIFIMGILSWLASVGLINNNTFSEFFTQTSEKSDTERSNQVIALIEGWQDNPLFGAGPGIDARVSRSEIPGTYEMSYVAKLFETGLVGFSIYILLWGTLFYWTLRCIKSENVPHKYIIATLAGMTIFMMSNATNPYLLAFDYMWFMYVPFVLINNVFPYYKLNNGKNRYINGHI